MNYDTGEEEERWGFYDVSCFTYMQVKGDDRVPMLVREKAKSAKQRRNLNNELNAN